MSNASIAKTSQFKIERLEDRIAPSALGYTAPAKDDWSSEAPPKDGYSNDYDNKCGSGKSGSGKSGSGKSGSGKSGSGKSGSGKSGSGKSGSGKGNKGCKPVPPKCKK